jgi:hypothetical protein
MNEVINTVSAAAKRGNPDSRPQQTEQNGNHRWSETRQWLAGARAANQELDYAEQCNVLDRQ